MVPAAAAMLDVLTTAARAYEYAGGAAAGVRVAGLARRLRGAARAAAPGARLTGIPSEGTSDG